VPHQTPILSSFPCGSPPGQTPISISPSIPLLPLKLPPYLTTHPCDAIQDDRVTAFLSTRRLRLIAPLLESAAKTTRLGALPHRAASAASLRRHRSGESTAYSPCPGCSPCAIGTEDVGPATPPLLEHYCRPHRRASAHGDCARRDVGAPHFGLASPVVWAREMKPG
jgi:hypothetical protein